VPPILGLLLLAPASPADCAGDGARLTIVLRYDDVDAKSDMGLEARILSALRSRGMRCTLGVTPRVVAGSAFDPAQQEGLPLPPEKIALLKDALSDGTAEVALHGFSHQTVRRKIDGGFMKPFGRYHSEFFGVSRPEQERKMAEGKRILEETLGVPVKTFIPPWNAYDWNTLTVAADLGFENFSAARRGLVLASSPLRFVPRTCDVADLREAVASARRVKDREALIVVLFHHYDFRESSPQNGRIDFGGFESLLDWLSRQGDLRIVGIAAAAASSGDLGPGRFWWNRNALLWQITPPLLNRLLPSDAKPLYLGVAAARALKVRLWIVVLGVYLGIAAAAGWLAGRIAPRLRARSPRLARGAVGLSLAAFAAVVVAALWDGEPYSGGATAAFFMAGACVGVWRGAAGGSARSAILRAPRGSRSPAGSG
jgi:predicted deacetylase